MAQFVDNVQAKIKTTTSQVSLFACKVLSGMMIGLTLSLILQEIFSYGSVLLLFVILMTTVVFMRIAKPWPWMTVMVFDLICVLIGLVLRMYILIAPGT